MTKYINRKTENLDCFAKIANLFFQNFLIPMLLFLFSSAVCTFGEKVVFFLCKKKQLNHAFCNIFLT